MAHAPTATRPHVAFGRVTTNNGAVWYARGRRRVGQSNAASGWCVRLVARAFFACDAKETKETKKQQK